MENSFILGMVICAVLNLLENIFGNVLFIAWLKIIVNDLGSLAVTSAVVPATVLSAVWYFLFFSPKGFKDFIKVDCE